MSNEKEILKILWANIIGDTKEQIESLSWEGAATFILDQTGQMVITSLVPAGFVVAPIVSWFINTVGRAADKTYQDWGGMKMHINESGIAVLEKSSLRTASQKIINLPDKIEIPSAELIKPSENLRLNPSVQVPGGRSNYSRRSDFVRQLLRDHKLQSSNSRQQQFDLPPRRRLWENRTRSFSTIRNDVLYPEWAFTGTPPKPGRSPNLFSLSDIESRKRESSRRDNLAASAAAQKHHQQFLETQRKHVEDSLKRSRDNADRARKQQREQMERQRRNQQNHWRHKK